MRRKLFLGFFAAVLCMATCSCSTGHNHKFNTLTPSIDARGYGRIVVVTRDLREHVSDGTMKPQEVGTARGMYGDPWTIETESGQPLSQDISTSICNSLIGRGYDCIPLTSGNTPVPEEINYLLQTQRPVRILFVSLREWFASVYMGSELAYDLELAVWNRMGEPMTTVSIKGDDELANVSYFNPAKGASAAVPERLETLLGQLLTNKRVTSALSLVRPIDELGAKY